MIKFLLIGNKNSGKTTYITTLSMQSNITIKNPKTLQYLQSLKNIIRKNKTIKQTNDFIKLDFNYKKNNNIIEFQIDDYDGNLVEKFHLNPTNHLIETIKTAQAILLFIPFEENIDFNLYDEIDMFIEDLKNKKIPLTITITKCDKLNQDCKIWLQQTHTNLLKKLKLYFDTINIIPISSFKEYNILKPIDISLVNIPKEWEYKVSQITDKKELLLYLTSIKENIKYYPSYLELYNKTENEVFNEIYTTLQKLNLYKFIKYEKQHKKLLSTFSNSHKTKIKNLKNSLILNISKESFIILIAIAIFSIITFLFISQNTYYQKEQQLYTNIKNSYNNNNIQKTLLLIQKYKKNYTSHTTQINKIYINLITKCQKDVNIKYHLIPELKSIKHKYKLANELDTELKLCNISQKPFIGKIKNINTLYQKYVFLTKEIQNLSINNLNKFNISKFNNILFQISSYSEVQEIKEKLNKKFELISNSISNNDINTIQNLINIAIQLNLPNKTISHLNKKLLFIQTQNAFAQFIDELTPMDFNEALSYIKIQWQKKFNSYTNLLKIKQLLNTKFNQEAQNNLSDINDIFIANSNDLVLFKKELNKIYLLTHTKIKIINYIPQLNNNNKNEYRILLNRYYKYHSSRILPTKIKFIADNKNNKPLDFKCNGDNKIKILITKNKLIYKYNYKNSQCFDTTIIFNNSHKFYIGTYSIKIIKLNTFFDKTYKSIFKITRNDIINIKNNSIIQKNLGNGYKLTLIP